MIQKPFPYQLASRHRHLLTDDQVAGFLAVLLKTVLCMIKDCSLPHHWVLGSIFVSAAGLDAFITMSRTT
jgi:hypothetical protein